MIRRVLRLVLSVGLVCLVGAGGCSSGGTTGPTYDQGAFDTGSKWDGSVQDWGSVPDLYPTPVDKSVTPKDYGPTPDGSLCGNKKVDSPAETCDKAITAGKEGACPTSLADCDDQNSCTDDSLTGSAATCTAACVNAPKPNCCGNGTMEGTEECDDGNVVDKDGCSNQCKLPGGHLLITEVATSPTEAEFIEIYNPSTAAVALDGFYLADRVDYFMVTVKDGLKGVASDFVARFPAGASIGPGAYLTIAVQGALNYKIAYGISPDYELKNTDTTIPDLEAPQAKAIGSTAGLTDGGELVILFNWDGGSDLVEDIDYVVWKGASAAAVSKTSICVDGIDADTTDSCYLADTDVTTQSYLSPPSSGGSLHRCDYLEGTEKQNGGNGATGHDETSEPLGGTSGTWKRNPKTLAHRTPGEPAPVGFCPQ